MGSIWTCSRSFGASRSFGRGGKPHMKVPFQTRGRSLLLVAAVLAAAVGGPNSSAGQERPPTPTDPLSAWRTGVKISPVSGENHHSIHAYFNTSPESPDGRRVLFYVSTTA